MFIVYVCRECVVVSPMPLLSRSFCILFAIEKCVINLIDAKTNAFVALVRRRTTLKEPWRVEGAAGNAGITRKLLNAAH